MAFGFRKFLSGLNIVPKTTSTVNSAGDIDFDTTANKMNLHNGTTSSPIVTEAHSAVLTNKTIDADSNTISNIENADIKAAAAIDATKIADGTVTNAEFQYVGGVTSDIQTQLNGKQATGNYITALTGDVTASGPGSAAATVASVGGSSAANVAAAEALANAATNLNTASTIVKRDASGDFSAGTITAGLTGNVIGNVSGTALNVTGTVAIANGGTGQTAKTAAFDALSPNSTKGDLVAHDGTNNIRLPAGSDGKILVADSTQASGLKWGDSSGILPVASKTANYTLTTADSLIIADSVGGAFTLTLPPASSNTGKVFQIKKQTTAGFNVVTIDANGSETIDGALTRNLVTPNESYTIVSDGTNWKILDHVMPELWTSFSSAWRAVTVDPTLGNGTLDARWKRIGDSAQIEIKLTVGGTSATGTGDYYFQMPAGMVIDLTKVPTSIIGSLGTGPSRYYSSGSGNTYIATVEVAAGGSYVYAGRPQAASTYVLDSTLRLGTNFAVPNATDEYHMLFTVPITDWEG